MVKRPEYIVVGRFGRPKGLSGEINVNSLSTNPERFRKPGTFWVETDDGLREIKIKSFGSISKRPTAKIAGVDNPEQAQKLTNRLIYIRSENLPVLPDGRYYDFDLIDCRVESGDGRQLGRLVDVEHYPASDVWVIEMKDKRRCLFPAVDEFVDKVDVENKMIIITPPEGIFDSPDED